VTLCARVGSIDVGQRGCLRVTSPWNSEAVSPTNHGCAVSYIGETKLKDKIEVDRLVVRYDGCAQTS